jgi:hypothetical protein
MFLASSSIWILLLSISMILFPIANSGFAFVFAYDPETAQKEGMDMEYVI